MNQVTEFLAAISDADLKAAICELKVFDEQAVLPPNGVIRRLGAELVELADIDALDARKVLESGLFRRAAYQWAQA